ncbi:MULTISPECIES: glycosyltransferase family 4 protein [Rhodococcus]|uniref:glycosyltransferase family 4 protein n=1 Tax=Rhodococcus TaxID=1827 RepID=UPI0035239C45
MRTDPTLVTSPKLAPHIGFGALALRPSGSGVQTYVRELLNALDLLLPAAALRASVQHDATGELPCRVAPHVRPVADGVRRMLYAKMPVWGVDLFHSLDVDVPVLCSGVTVSTFHDLAVFDTPWAFGKYRAAGERALLRDAMRRADVLVAVSNFTAERLHALCGREAVVTPLAPAVWAKPPTPEKVRDIRRAYRLPERFVLQVGTVEPRKDVALVADACRILDIPLVLAGAGSTGPDAPAGSIGLGYVPTAHLPALYAAASAVAYASRYEGFGLPPLEAMACGGAVVTSAVGALPDIVDDGALLVTEHTETSWTAALRVVVHDTDTADALRARGREVAATSTWRRTAELTRDAYRIAGLRI